MPLQQKTPLRPTGFKPKVRSAARLAEPKPAKGMKRSKMRKASRPKMTPIRKAARGRDCTLMIPGVCNHDPATTVLCHSNALADGKGMGLKAPDTEACFGCAACHDVLDGRRARPDWLTYELLQTAFGAARARTHDILRKEGIIT